MSFDLVITNGTLVDCAGRPRFRADLGIQEGEIAAVATGTPLNDTRTLDGTGLVVPPGLIDLHSPADWILPLKDHDQILTPFLLQGVSLPMAQTMPIFSSPTLPRPGSERCCSAATSWPMMVVS